MSEEIDLRQLNYQIALFMGWYPPSHEETKSARQQSGLTHSGYDSYWLSPAHRLEAKPLPFASDIASAMLVEDRIKELGLEEQYGDALAYIVMDSTMWSLGRVYERDIFAIAHASAEQRCRAARKVACGEERWAKD